MKFLVLCVAIVAVSATAFGQTYPHFVEVKGDHEFTGQMIARPKQMDQLLNEGLTSAQAVSRKQLAARLVGPVALQYRPQLDDYILNVPAGLNEDAYAKRLLSSGAFQYVEPNWKVFITTNDPLYPQQWHLPQIHADTGWDLFVGNNSITVALTDTGIRQDHVDLQGALVPGYNAVQGLTQAQGGDVGDTNGHGTHTAGIAGAVGNNSIGVTGVCQHVHVMPIKVVVGGSGGSSIATLTGGAIWAADHGARVVSTSFSGFDSSNTVQTTGDYIKHTRNGLYCWAAGNDGRNLSNGGDWPDVTIVGATDHGDVKASFSAYGLATDVFAPGVNILSTYAGSSTDYELDSGTSMATPCVAGVGAMILMANPSLTGQNVEDILYQSCDSMGNSVSFGWGRVNLNSALLAVYNTTTFSPNVMTLIRGQVTSGDVSLLGAMDNQSVGFQGDPVFGHAQYGLAVRFDTTSTISHIGTLTLTYAQAAASPMLTETLELFDWSANAWVRVDQRVVPMTDTSFTISPASPDRFRNPVTGVISARATYDSLLASRAGAFSVSVDQVAFLTKP